MTYIPRTLPEADYLRIYKNGLVWLKPPKIDSQEPMNASISNCCEEKLSELVIRYEAVFERFKHNTKHIKNIAMKNKWDDFSLLFYISFESYEAIELYYIKRWMRYWSYLYELSSGTKIIPEKEGVLTEEDIQRAKEHPIEDLLDGDYRVQYGKILTLCPFHSERTPSFTIFTSDNHCHCFGCGFHSDAIGVYQKLHNVSFIEAVRRLNE